MYTIIEILNLSTDYLKQKQIESARRQAEELLGEALGIGRMSLYLEFDRPLTDEEVDRCRSWLKRRGQGEPLQYICGEVEFLGCKLKITRDVLIPRPETEILADKISKELSSLSLDGKILWDVCCGSGCLGIALKKRHPDLQVELSDLSPAALAVAKGNATQNNARVAFFEGDLLHPFQGRKADFMVCNPPYVTESEYASLQKEVKDFEPKQALVSGETGLECYERLAMDLPHYLNSGGRAWFEIGDGQGEAIKKRFHASYWKKCEVERDWSGRERFFSLEIE